MIISVYRPTNSTGLVDDFLKEVGFSSFLNAGVSESTLKNHLYMTHEPLRINSVVLGLEAKAHK